MDNNTDHTEDAGRVPATRPEAVPDLGDVAEQLVAQARADGVNLTGPGGVLTGLVRRVLETGLEAELSDHLGHEHRGQSASGNHRNGTSAKTITTELGEIDIAVPRDRDGTFNPQTVPKHKRRLDGFNASVISLFARGMTTGEIAGHLTDIYDTTISRETISKITDAVVDDLNDWAARPLDPIYPVILIDAIVIKIRDGAVANRPVYVAMGVTLDGERDVLGMWVGPTGGEGAKQWMNMLTDLRNRGVLDACIVCCDGLPGLPDAIRAIWPRADVQTCVVHLVRNSLRYASRKDWSKITKQMRLIYTAPTVDAATERLEEFAQAWGEQYPAMIGAWERAWDDFVPFLAFPPEIRKLVYTTNAIESLNARFRRATRQRGHFPTERAAMKILYLSVTIREKNRPNPTGRIHGWKSVLNTLTVHYGERLTNPANQAD
jgi:transposase-like protein